MPCRNEERWIGPCLQSIFDNDYPRDLLEVLVVDGMSSDGTEARPSRSLCDSLNCECLPTKRRSRPRQLNLGIAAASGSVIVRMDAHVEYPATYISSLVNLLETSGADNVGGICLAPPAGETPIARAIAPGMSHPLGVGNSLFSHRLGGESLG